MQTESMQAPQGQELSYLYGIVPASHQHLGCAQTSEGIAEGGKVGGEWRRCCNGTNNHVSRWTLTVQAS